LTTGSRVLLREEIIGSALLRNTDIFLKVTVWARQVVERGKKKEKEVTLFRLHEGCCKYLLIEKGETWATISTYKANFREYCSWLENEGKPVEVTSLENYQILREFMYHLAERKLHRNTIRQRIISLKTFCKYLLCEGIFNRNPFARFDIRKKAKALLGPYLAKHAIVCFL
jgi:site-specific recombinase XerD